MAQPVRRTLGFSLEKFLGLWINGWVKECSGRQSDVLATCAGKAVN